MPINEIEINGVSISFRLLNFKFDDMTHLMVEIKQAGDQFSIESETQGFHDVEMQTGLIRGYFSMVIPFEVEHIIAGITTKGLFKRVETCEFFITDGLIFVSGKSGPQKVFERVITRLSGYGTSPVEFEFHQLSQFQDRLSQMKSIALTNPKDKEIRRARLAGKIEEYTEYNVIDPRNHGIESVSGLVDSPLGPITVTVFRKGVIRLGVRRGFILAMDCLLWIVALIREEKPHIWQE